MTRQLIKRAGFSAVAVEADWPDAFHINRYLQAAPTSNPPSRRWPRSNVFRLVWRNVEVAEFITGLRGWNDECSMAERVGFYGLDRYSLHASMRAVVE